MFTKRSNSYVQLHEDFERIEQLNLLADWVKLNFPVWEALRFSVYIKAREKHGLSDERVRTKNPSNLG